VYQTIIGSIAQSVGVSPQRNGEINVDEKTATESSPQKARLRGCPPTERGGLRSPYLSACLAKKFWENVKQEVAVNTIEENYQAEGVKVGIGKAGKRGKPEPEREGLALRAAESNSGG